MNTKTPTFRQITSPPFTTPDQPHADQLDTVLEEDLTPIQQQWREFGCLVIKGLMPGSIINQYNQLWLQKNPGDGGWPSPTPYMHYDAIRDVSLNRGLVNILGNILGDEVTLSLNETRCIGKSGWNQIGYLNPPEVGNWYIASAVALEKIELKAGPIQYVLKSHKWPRVDREKVFDTLGLSDGEKSSPSWPQLVSGAIDGALAKEIWNQHAPIKTFEADKGDVFIWHSGLIIRDAVPTNPDARRKMLISHYSTLSHRDDMPIRNKHKTGGWYCVHNDGLN